MATIGVLSKDAMTKNRIFEILKLKGHSVSAITSIMIDTAGFDLIMVDLEDERAMLILKNHGHKCLGFAAADETKILKDAEDMGCQKIMKNGEFYKKYLPNFTFPLN